MCCLHTNPLKGYSSVNQSFREQKIEVQCDCQIYCTGVTLDSLSAKPLIIKIMSIARRHIKDREMFPLEVN